MRLALTCAVLLVLTGFSKQSTATCGDAALAVAPDDWDATSALSGDLTMDGEPDIVYWRRDGGAVLLYVVACEEDQPRQTWRFRVPLDDDCPPNEVVVQVAALLLDASLVERVCARGETEECQHMRRENERRQAIVDAGGREVRVGGPPCPVTHLRWDEKAGGFMRIGG